MPPQLHILERYPRLRHLPNWLTLVRVAAVPIVVLMMMTLTVEPPDSPTGWHREVSFILAFIFAVAAVTDVIDGYLARKWEVETVMGAFLDPMADKLMVLATMIMLVALDRAPAWVVITILGREIAVTGLRSLAVDKGIIIKASGLGKYKTVFQVIAILGLLVYYDYDYSGEVVTYATVGTVFLYVALIFTVWSGWEYFREFWVGAVEKTDPEPAIPGTSPTPHDSNRATPHLR